MGNEMGNNNTSVLKDEENTAVETFKTSLEDATHENDKNELHQLVPVVEGQGFHEKVANLASDDAERIGNPCVENQTSNLEVGMSIENQNTEVHPLGETPRVTKEAIEAGDTDSKSDTILNDPAHEKPIAKNVESDGKADEEDERISTSDDLEPKENITVEAYQISLLKSTRENGANDENKIEVGVQGNYFLHENVAYLATDALKAAEDPGIENQKSITQEVIEQEDCEDPPLGELPQVTMKSTIVSEEDSKVQPVTLLSDAGHEEPTEQKKKETDIQEGTVKYQLDKQDYLKTEDEEGTLSTSFDLEAKDSERIESNQPELVTIDADQSVESLLGSKDRLGPSFDSDFEVDGHVIDTGTLRNMEESADSSPDPALERQEDVLSPEPTACHKRLKFSKEQFDTENGQKVKNGFSDMTLIAPFDLVGLGNNCNVELPTEVYLIDSPKSEPEVLLLSNSRVEVPEPMDNFTVLIEEIRLAEKEMENGEEKHYTNQIQPCPLSGMHSEPDCDKPSESSMIKPTHEKCQMISVMSPSSNKVSEAENPKVVEDGGLVLMRLNNQHEASEDQCYQESERKLHVVPELGIISPELGIPHFSLKEEELVGKKNVQEREDDTQLSVAIEMEETERAEQDCLPPEESTFENVQSIDNSITESKQENYGEFFAAENPAIDFTSWIAEALVSMNNLEAEMLGQQVTQLNEARHAEAEALATESNTLAEVETSSVSVSSSSETHETVGRSSTVSTESDPDNLNIAHARIQKSPSFSLDLQNEARTEKSDGTPLLFQDKAKLESSANQGEKVDTLQRSESEESKTRFLGFLKEQEEINIVKQNIRENISTAENATKNLVGSLPKKATTSSKRKEKRRHRPSLFSNCLCCATVIS